MSITSEQNAIIDAGTSFFRETLHNAGALAWSEIEPQLNDLSVDHLGHVDRTPKNEEIANEMINAIMHGAQSEAYAAGLQEMENTIDELADAARQYYAEQNIYLQTTSYNYDRMLKGLQTTIKNDLKEAFGVDSYQSEISNPAYNAFFKYHVNQKSTKDATKKDMQHRIEDRFVNFATTPLSTIMQQYTRRIHEIFAMHGTDELIWVHYEGIDDHLNRDFCDHYIKKSYYYHVDEVKEWPTEFATEGIPVAMYASGSPVNGLWEGAIPGTDRGSIFVNAGGFNCRHNFEYVTQREVEKNEPASIARAKTKGLPIYYRNEN